MEIAASQSKEGQSRMSVLSVMLLLPEQTINSNYSRGEQKLALAMTERALRDLEHPALRANAEAWLSGRQRGSMSFSLVMDWLGIEGDHYEALMKLDPKVLRRPHDVGLSHMTITPHREREANGTNPFVE